jgi:hypothetical protein
MITITQLSMDILEKSVKIKPMIGILFITGLAYIFINLL